MPDTLTNVVTSSFLGRSYSMDQSVTGENVFGSSPNVTPAVGGATLTTRTDANTGELTFAAAHGITTGAKLVLFWTIDGVNYHQRGVVAGTVAGLVVPIDSGVGDDLPPLNTEDIAVKVIQEEGTTAVVGANVVGLTVRAPNYFTVVVFRTSGGTEIAAVVLEAGESYTWSSASGVTNPVTGQTVGKISFAHADTAGTQETPAYGLYN